MMSRVCTKEALMSDRTYSLSRESFEMFSSQIKGSSRIRYATKQELLDGARAPQRELMLESIEFVCPPLSPSEIIELADYYREGGQCVSIQHLFLKGKYLGSDRGGHYSTDYYEYYQYTHIKVDLA
jgi:hypothetical protein